MPATSFPKTVRLNNADEFRSVFRQAQYKVSNRCLLALAIDNNVECSRLGLVIAKKHVKKAVQRNRVKRVLRDSFRRNQELLVSLDIVILARSGVDSLTNHQLAENIGGLWDDLVRKASTQQRRTRTDH